MKKTFKREDYYQKVTDRILVELEKGALPWIRPWQETGANIPLNAVTERRYTGGNVFLLWLTAQMNHWSTLRFLTYKQAQEAGGQVRKGEHGTNVYFWKKLTYTAKNKDGEDEEKENLMMRQYTVFNVEQIDGLPEKIAKGAPVVPLNKDQRNAAAEAFLKGTKADIREDGDKAYYVPSGDFIYLPKFEHFKDADNFYGTAFHELTHWTGHKTRLNRDFTGRFDRQAYAAEELVAELGAAFLNAEFGFTGEIRDAGYIQHWIKLLQSDKRAFFTAASKAQQAADFLRNLVLADEPAPASSEEEMDEAA